ncbi:MAG TPA: YbhB/YbcL family Raf kinase inhibitor-like protein, partial [Chlamydiales bacterium]|nr:YbhB/YbcL family Raf kinase inhibitor-like protein [Chlamydiales bacterium]
MAFELTSKAFENGQKIPKKYTCDAEDLSPPLAWKDVPQGTKSFTIIMDDPDAPSGTWLHWIIYDIPGDYKELHEKIHAIEISPKGVRQGMTDFRRIGYGGPCPPPGKPHRYFFRLYALDTTLDLKPRCSREELEKAMKGHILAE